eukprot:TRINITY_DN48846_c0_g1_i1.p1 TRINITY_DN48846_c0_g1~~TRINITY_DN48846_c0_g1_i1.p1  ORF type:complete len:1400 (+),score=149.72 TRINITY_DN48846_c0_g1_i1:88-4287(+)
MERRGFGIFCGFLGVALAKSVEWRSALAVVPLDGSFVAAQIRDGNVSCTDATQPSKTCLFNESMSFITDFLLDFDGDVVFSSDINITARGDIRLAVSGRIVMRSGVRLSAGRDIILSSRDLACNSAALFASKDALFNSSTSNTSSVTFEGADLAVAAQRISVIAASFMFKGKGTISAVGHITISASAHAGVRHCIGLVFTDKTKLSCSDFVLSCPDGSVRFLQHAVVQSESNVGKITVDAAAFSISSNAALMFRVVHVSARGQVDISTSALGGTYEQGAHHEWAISTQGDLVISPPLELRWRLQRLTLVARRIVIEDSYISNDEDSSDSCANRDSARVDFCRQMLDHWGTSDDGALRVLNAADRAGTMGLNLTFDVSILAQELLTIATSTLSAASMLLCSGGIAEYRDHAKIDSCGRGCPRGRGKGHGRTSNSSHLCGGSGASGFGKGGRGIRFAPTRINTCSNSSSSIRSARTHLLPTEGASGGGCGIMTSSCTSHPSNLLKARPSSGGGLIWLSAHILRLHRSVSVWADGIAGDMFVSSGLSGGGSGGKIFMFASTLDVLGIDAEPPVILSARGGDGCCTRWGASGGGAGGFVGFNVSQSKSTIDNTSVLVHVTGGGLPGSCQQFGPVAARLATGGKGMKRQLASCEAGYAGIFCSACPVGKYSADGKDCHSCRNKVSNSEYTNSAWPNSSCPFQCALGTHDFALQNMCVSAAQYTFLFFGGFVGCAMILAAYIVSSCLLLRKKTRRRNVQAVQASFLQVEKSGLAARCQKRFDSCLILRSGDHFPLEQLPYHVCRVFLSGQNCSECSWELARSPPPQIEHLVLKEAWADFASEFNRVGCAPYPESWFVRLLQCIYPPLAVVKVRMHRRARAIRLRQCATRFSGEIDGRQLWTPRQLSIGENSARCSESHGLTLAFGSDESATLGFLDVFDFSKSQLDWAPIDLQSEVRLLVAHGDGSYADPFAIDSGDPLVQHLSQMDISNHALCSVISTFNCMARRVTSCPHGDEIQNLAIDLLRYKVGECAAACGIWDKVLVLPAHFDGPNLIGRLSSSHDDQIAEGSDTRSSFNDIVERSEADGGDGTRTCGQRRQTRHVKLCLAFTDITALELNSSGTVGTPLSPRSSLPCFSSTMSQHAMKDYLIASSDLRDLHDSTRGDTHASSMHSDSSSSGGQDSAYASSLVNVRTAGLVARPKMFSHAWWISLAWRDCCNGSPSAVLLCLMLLSFVDILLCLIIWSMVVKIGWVPVVVWIACPPFAHAVALCFGLLLGLTQSAWTGRMFAIQQLFSIISPALTYVTLVIIRFPWPSFQFFMLNASIVVKVAIFIATHLHIANLETTWDLSFGEASQGDFICQILSSSAVELSTSERFAAGVRGDDKSSHGSSARTPTLPQSFADSPF